MLEEAGDLLVTLDLPHQFIKFSVEEPRPGRLNSGSSIAF